MPYNGSGVFTIPNSFTPATTILSSAVNANFLDIATGLSNVLTRDNQAPMTAPLRLADGSAALPGLQFASDTNTGLRRSGADEMRWVAGGADRFYIDANGVARFLDAVIAAAQLVAGHTAPLSITGNTPRVQALGTDNMANVTAARYSADANPPRFDLVKSRHGTIGSHTVVQNGDPVGQMRYLASDGAEYRVAAVVLAHVDGTPGSGDMPGRLILQTTPDSSATPVERMTIRADGKVQIPNSVAPLIQFDGSGFVDLTEIAAPANPAANVARVYARDVGGTTFLAYRDSAGLERVFNHIGVGELVAIIEDQKAQNTAGQTLTGGVDNVRDLNTLVYNRDTLVSLSSNRFTLPAGTWEIEWIVPTGNVDNIQSVHQSFLYNFTDSSEVARGMPGAFDGVSGTTAFFTAYSSGRVVVTIAASKAFEIRHRTGATIPGGSAANMGTEVYTRVVVRRA